ncbi:DUF3955 domain-containing protein [Neisseriaceae bacterium CLB008]
MSLKLMVVLCLLAIAAFVYNAQNTYLDGDGVLHDTVYLPLGYLLLLGAVCISLFRFLRTIKRQRQA